MTLRSPANGTGGGGGGAVSSVNGKTGAVTITSSDVSAQPLSITNPSGVINSTYTFQDTPNGIKEEIHINGQPADQGTGFLYKDKNFKIYSQDSNSNSTSLELSSQPNSKTIIGTAYYNDADDTSYSLMEVGGAENVGVFALASLTDDCETSIVGQNIGTTGTEASTTVTVNQRNAVQLQNVRLVNSTEASINETVKMIDSLTASNFTEFSSCTGVSTGKGISLSNSFNDPLSSSSGVTYAMNNTASLAGGSTGNYKINTQTSQNTGNPLDNIYNSTIEIFTAVPSIASASSGSSIQTIARNNQASLLTGTPLNVTSTTKVSNLTNSTDTVIVAFGNNKSTVTTDANINNTTHINSSVFENFASELRYTASSGQSTFSTTASSILSGSPTCSNTSRVVAGNANMSISAVCAANSVSLALNASDTEKSIVSNTIITGIDPINPSDLATKRYVDANPSDVTSVNTLTGAVVLTPSNIGATALNVPTPTLGTDATNKAYVDSGLAGKTDLVVPTPTTATMAANKAYVDTVSSSSVFDTSVVLPVGVGSISIDSSGNNKRVYCTNTGSLLIGQTINITGVPKDKCIIQIITTSGISGIDFVFTTGSVTPGALIPTQITAYTKAEFFYHLATNRWFYTNT